MVGYPVTDEVQHQFLGLVTRKLPNGANNPSYDDVNLDGDRDDRVKARERFIREAYEGSDETMRLAQDRMRDKDLTTFVGSDHGFAPQFLAIDASKVLVDLGLLSHPQISNCRAQNRRADPRVRDDRQGQGVLRRRRRADLPERVRPRPGDAGRCAAGGRPRLDQPPAPRRGERGVRGRPGQGRLPGPHRTPTTGPTTASPRAGRSSTASTPRPRPATSRTGRTARPTWPTRPVRVTWSPSATRRTSSTRRRPAR